MANKKISELDSRASLDLSDLLAIGDPTTGYLYKTTITDLKALTGAGVISYNGRVGAVVPVEGDYSLTQLSDVIITSPSNNQVLQFNGSNWVNAGSNFITLSSLSATTPLSYNSSTGAFSIQIANASQAGYLSSTDWNTFNNKQAALGYTAANDSLVVHLAGTETITGIKTFSAATYFGAAFINAATSQLHLGLGSSGVPFITTQRSSIGFRTDTAADGSGGTNKFTIGSVSNGGQSTLSSAASFLSTNAVNIYGDTATSANTFFGVIRIASSGYFATTAHKMIGWTYVSDGNAGTTIYTTSGSAVVSALTLAASGAATFNSSVTASSIIKSGGTSSQFLKADGSVDSNTYLTTSSGSSSYVPYTGATGDVNIGARSLYTSNLIVTSGGSGFLAALTADTLNGIGILNLTNAGKNGNLKPATMASDRTWTLPDASGTIALTSDIPSLAGLVTLNTMQTIGGTKIYTALQYYDNGVYIKEGTGASTTGYTSLGAGTNQLKIGVQGAVHTLTFPTSASYTYTFPGATGTLALTSDLSSYVPTSRTITINGTAYDLSADRSWTVSGSQWTTSGSNIYYNTGNVGIGISNPSFPLEVSSTSTTLLARFTSNQANAAIRIVNTSASGGRTYSIGSGDTTSGAGNNFYIYDETNGALRFAINNSGSIGIGTASPTFAAGIGLTISSATRSNFSLTNGTSALNIFQDGTSAYFNMYSAGDMIFRTSTSNTQRMAIKNANNGTIVFGTAEAAASSINFYGNYSNSQPGYIIYNSSGTYILEFNGNTKALYLGSLGTGALYSSAGIITNTNPSDIRLKENVLDITYGLKDILKLRPVSYKWKNDKVNQGIQFGFIAQEVKEIMPDSIKEFGEDVKYLGLEKDAIYATLVNAIQEQQAQIEDLKAKLN